MQPLTHHEILDLIAPFPRGSRHVDLAASDRLERRLVFKPIEHPATNDHPSVLETLTLEDSGAGTRRLVRLLAPAVGPAAHLEAEGSRIGEMVARIDAVPLQRQCQWTDPIATAVSFRLAPDREAPFIFLHGEAHVGGLILTLESPSVKGMAASVTLTATAGAAPRLPQDSLAVLGGAWSRLRESGNGWAGELRLRGGEPQRSRQAEAALDQAARHLGQLLAERPARFHERWIAARWRVFFRRLVPLIGCVALIACAAAVPRLHLAEGSGLRMLILNSPPLLMILFFCLREIPIVEIPPLPRRSAAASWSAGPEGGS